MNLASSQPFGACEYSHIDTMDYINVRPKADE